MKKKIFLVVSAMLVFGLAIVVFSYGKTTNVTSTAAACCCCRGDSCPVTVKNASAKGTASTHENCDCCGDSCPMMKKDADGKAMKMDGAHSCPIMKKDGETAATAATAVKKEGAESCPMMKDDPSHKMEGMKHEMKADGTGQCCGCCSHNKEKKDAPAI